MAAGIGSRFGTGIKQLEPVDDAGHIIMDYSIHDAIEAGFNHVVFIIRNDDVSRSIFEYGLTREQYKRIMDLMQDYRERIERGEKCGHGGFEQAMYEIVPDHRGDYHMCEELVKGFRDENRWEEVFDNLYGEKPKYSYLKLKDE